MSAVAAHTFSSGAPAYGNISGATQATNGQQYISGATYQHGATGQQFISGATQASSGQQYISGATNYQQGGVYQTSYQTSSVLPTQNTSNVTYSTNSYGVNQAYVPVMRGTETVSGGLSTTGYSVDARQHSTGYISTTAGSPTAMDAGAYEQSRRKVSSVVVSEEVLEQPRQDGVRYVEVPYIEEVVKTIPVHKVIEVEKIVPKHVVEYVDRVVEVPQIEYVTKNVDVVQRVEKVVEVPRKEIVDVPREVIKVVEVPGPVVEKVVEVPGPVISVDKPYTVENKIPVIQYTDQQRPVVVAQTVQPVVVEGSEALEVEVLEYEPQVVVVDVHVAKPVSAQVIAAGMKEEIHRVVDVPAAQYNTILRTLNPHVGVSEQVLPFIKENGQVPFLPNSEFSTAVAPLSNVTIEGYNAAMTTQGNAINRGYATARGTQYETNVRNHQYEATTGTSHIYGTPSGAIIMEEAQYAASHTRRSHHHNSKKHQHGSKHHHGRRHSASAVVTTTTVPVVTPMASKKKAWGC